MRAIYTPRFGCARILTEPSGLYQPVAEGGVDAAILGVVDRFDETVDIVAWLPSDPCRWWLRRGAMPVLGEVEIELAAVLDVPVYLFGSPHDWLFNHSTGGYWPACAILDWSIDPRITFKGVRVIAHGEAVARQLEQAQRRHDRPLDIQVAPNEAERAAA